MSRQQDPLKNLKKVARYPEQHLSDAKEERKRSLKQFVCSGDARLVNLVKRSLTAHSTFSQFPGITVDAGLDFGVIVSEDVKTPISTDRLGMIQQVHLSSSTILYSDSVDVTVECPGEMWCIGGASIPEVRCRLLYVDPSNLFLLEESQPYYLAKNETYSIRVYLNAENGQDKEYGLIKQRSVLMFAFPLEGAKGNSRGKKMCSLIDDYNICYEDVSIGDCPFRIFCLGFNVVAMIVKRDEYSLYKKPLNIKAKPFYSKQIREIFNTEPEHLFCNFEATILEALLVDQALLFSPACQSLEVDSQRYTIEPRCLEENRIHETLLQCKTLVDTYTVLLQSEALQQILDIKDLDLHFVRPRVVFLQEWTHSRYRVIGMEDVSIYRGFLPLDRLKLARDNALLVIKVPGIVEGQPSIHLGCIIHLRSISNPSEEYACICCSIERDNVFLLPPLGFWHIASVGQTLHRLNRSPNKPKMHENGYLNAVSVRFGHSTLQIQKMLAGLQDSDVLGLIPRFATALTVKRRIPDTERLHNLASEIEIETCLNREQALAVSSLILGGGRSPPFAMMGPPGTGKTLTLTCCVIEIIKRHPQATILCCAPQNFSADVLCSELLRMGLPKSKILRLNDPRRPIYEAKSDVLDCCIIDESCGIFQVPSKETMSRFQIIISSCVASEYVAGKSVTHVLIDEAAQALLPEALVPLRALKQSADPQNEAWGAFLCGDPRQLGPIIRSKAGSKQLGVSLLELLWGDDPNGLYNSIMLTSNYRSSNDLLKIPSKLFYQNKLFYAGDSNSTLPPEFDWADKDNVAPLLLPLVFFGVNGEHQRQGESSSFINKFEAVKLAQLIQSIIKSDSSITEDDMGVIALYRKQVHVIRALLREQRLHRISVGTVDDFQGQERKCVFISTVVSDLNDLPPGSHARSFFQNINRFNVAITRSKALLVVVGHPLVISSDPTWKIFLREALIRGSTFGSGSNILSSERTLGSEEEQDDDQSLLCEFACLAILGPASQPHDIDPFDEDSPWRVAL